MSVKVCFRCKRELPATTEYFHKHHQQKSGLNPTCKECKGLKFTPIPKDGYKICKKCGKELPANDNYFGSSNLFKDGFNSNCRECYRTTKQEYTKKHNEYIKANSQRYYQEHKEETKTRVSKYYQKNKDKYFLYNKEYRIKNAARINKQRKEYRDNNKKAISERDRLYRERNRERLLQQKKEYAQRPENKLRILDIKRKYKQKRRTLELSLPNDLSAKQWSKCKKYFNNTCAYCGKKLKRATQDHFIPITKGGGYTANNIVPSCPSCNSSKHNADFYIWYPKQPFYLQERERKITKYLDLAGQIELF